MRAKSGPTDGDSLRKYYYYLMLFNPMAEKWFKGRLFNQPAELVNKVRSSAYTEPCITCLTGLFLIHVISMYTFFNSDMYKT